MKLMLTVAAAILLAACSANVKDSLGLRKDAPDEFRVISMPPLAIPPDFDLRPPMEKKLQETGAMSQEARETVYGNAVKAVPTPTVRSLSLTSSAESNLLTKAGADKADPNIRSVLASETKTPERGEKKGWWKKLTTIGEKTPEEEQPIVDPEKEKQRIEENKKTGKSITEGETPTIKTEKSPLQKLLNQ